MPDASHLQQQSGCRGAELQPQADEGQTIGTRLARSSRHLHVAEKITEREREGIQAESGRRSVENVRHHVGRDGHEDQEDGVDRARLEQVAAKHRPLQQVHARAPHLLQAELLVLHRLARFG